MGLLSRAEEQPVLHDPSEAGIDGRDMEPLVLDAMEKALRERLERLPQKATTPYTALSLLKAYGIFKRGVCLVLKDNVYSSYASVGLGIGSILIPPEKIWNPEKSREKCFKLDSEKDLGLREVEEKIEYWIFPLELPARDEAPWEKIMILGVSDPSFNPEILMSILDGITDKVVKRPEQESEEAALPETGSGESVCGDFAAGEDESEESAEAEDSFIEPETEEEKSAALNEAEEAEPEEAIPEEAEAEIISASDESAPGEVIFPEAETEAMSEETFTEEAALPDESESGESVPDDFAAVEQEPEESAEVDDSFIEPETEEAIFAESEKAVHDSGSIFSGEGIPDTPEQKIAEYYKIYSGFNCIVLEVPSAVDHADMTDFCSKVSAIINMPGAVIPLPSGCPLILLPKMVDRELIAHRLSKTLNTKTLLSFEADSPENVISKISS